MNTTPILIIKNLTVTYPLGPKGKDKLKALDQISINLNAGQITGIVGESGAGNQLLVRPSWVFLTRQQNLLVVKSDFWEALLLV